MEDKKMKALISASIVTSPDMPNFGAKNERKRNLHILAKRLIGDLIFAATGERTSSNTISRIALSGRLEAVKILRAWRCTEEAFQAYIRAGRWSSRRCRDFGRRCR